MKHSLKYLAICLTAVLFFHAALPVQAAPPETGTLKIVLKEADCRVEFAVYRVADYEDGKFTMLPEFAEFNEGRQDPVDLNAIRDASEAERCAELLEDWAVSRKLPTAYQRYTEKGEVNLGKVPVGMFLIRQIPHEDDELKVLPFLIGVPYGKTVTENGETVIVPEYFVESQPKGEWLEPKPPTPTRPPVRPEPPEPEKPKPPTPTPGGGVRTGDAGAEQAFLYGTLLAAAGTAAVALEMQRRKKGRGSC